jgi:hypothetical protein
LDRLLESASQAFVKFEKKYGGRLTGHKFADVGVVRISAKIADEEFLQSTLHKSGVSPKFVELECNKYRQFRELVKGGPPKNRGSKTLRSDEFARDG